ncbi:MAG: TIGR02099 family protein [Betaproteobacteria bacterium]|nr:TIGR02099 family protein [Betaproteobacteria bacterium]
MKHYSEAALSLFRWIVRLSRFKRPVLWTGAVFVLLLSALVVYARFWLVPDLPRYLPEIETAASKALGQPVLIGSLEARLDFMPFVRLENVRVLSDEAAEHEDVVIQVASIEGLLSWRSLFFGQPVFVSLTLNQPELALLRAANGDWQIAGLKPSVESEEGPLQWLLAQQKIQVVDARINVRDDWVGAPDFSLAGVELDWQNQGERHRFGISARAIDAEGETAVTVEAHGDLRGEAGTPVSEWQGQIHLQWQAETLTPWRRWMAADESGDWPLGAFVDLTKSKARVDLQRGQQGWQATADVNLHDVRLRLGEALPELQLQEAIGHLSLSRDATGKWRFGSKGLRLVEEDGHTSAPLDLAASWQETAEEPDALQDDLPMQVSFSANSLDLAYLARLSTYLPLSDTARENLRKHNPQGVLEHVRFSWDRRQPLLRYALEADFSTLGLAAAGTMPGASGLSGRVRANEQGGQLTLDSRSLSVSLPAVFEEPSFPLASLQANVDWHTNASGIEVQIRRFDFSGPHVEGRVSGHYASRPGEAGFIDLNGNFTRARAAEVWRYIPKVAGAEVSSWLREALEAGTGDAQLVLRGNLEQFPFHGGEEEGIFRITVQARDVTLRYDREWPEITAISGDLEFGVGMLIRVAEGRIFSTRLSNRTTVAIPDFSAHETHLLVDGEVNGEMAEFLRFIEQSPVAASINHFTSGITGEGEGRLELKLDLPLARIEAGRAEGRYHFADNKVHFMADLPPARSVNGSLAFTRDDVVSDDIQGNFLEKPFKLIIQSQKDAVLVKADGAIAAAALQQELAGRLPESLLNGLSGGADLQMEIKVRGRTTDFLVTSTLEGLAMRLPDPFAKAAADRLALRFSKRNLGQQGRDEIIVSLGEKERRRLEALLIMRDERLERGAVAVGMPLRLPGKGLHVFLRQKRLDVDLWQSFLEDKGSKAGDGESKGSAEIASLPFPDMLSLEAQELHLLGRNFAEVNLRLLSEGEGAWRAMLASKEVVGDVNWNSKGEGRIIADLRRVRLEEGKGPLAGDGGKAELPDDIKKLPAMDVRIGDLAIGERRLGKVSMLAENDEGAWRLQDIVIENPDGRLTGRGVWYAKTNRSRLDFQLAVHDSGKLLGRLGYPDMLRGGNANLEGELEWRGAPTQFDAATLSGDLQVKASRGQFSKIDPGVGKLLGLLSLQSLTRRLSLDFRDIFSEGYAFDSLTAKLKIQDGVIATDGDLRIAGPSGVMLMNGTADMATETQGLTLIIQPEMGGVAAVGVAIAVNPLVGAAAFLAQTILKNPLNKVVSLRYRVTGSWDDPVVERKTRLPVLGGMGNDKGEEGASGVLPPEQGTP